MKKYYEYFCGKKVSDYGLKYGRLDYRTLASCFDIVLCNNIASVDTSIWENVESGSFEEYYYDGEEITEEEYYEIENEEIEEKDPSLLERCDNDIFQYYLFDSSYGLELLKEAGELVFYSELLDCYVWGVCHYGTSWDYVLTSIKLEEVKE